MKSTVIISAVFLSLLFAPGVSSGALSSWYSDVPDHYWHYDGIFYMTQAGYVTGYEDGTFDPERLVSRVEALKMLMEARENKDDTVSDTSVSLPFSDLSMEAWYFSYVTKAYNLGIVSNNENHVFRPEDPINRVEALKILVLANGRKSELPGVVNEAWYTAYLAYGMEQALIVPDETGNYLPEDTLSRGELSDLIYRFKKQPFTTQVEYGIASYYGNSFDEHNTASGKALDTDGFMAAHKTLPFGAVVRITNLDTKVYVDVEVVDRGPYTENYIVDLTPTAFEQIGLLSTGILKVRLEVMQ